MNYLSGLFTRNIEEVAKEAEINNFDCIIIGGGTSGLIFASTLGKSGLRVLLIEAGPLALFNHVNNTELRFSTELSRGLQRKLEYSPKTINGENYGRFVSCLGGRGLFWNGASPRFQPNDFKNWQVTYEMLESYYERAENAFNVSTNFGDSGLTQYICKTLLKNNINALPGPFAVDTQENSNGIIGGTIGNGLSVFLREKNWTTISNTVSVVVNCFADKLILNNTKNQVEGIVVIDKETNRQFNILAKSVVLAAGAFESTQLVLKSEIPDDNDIIGRYISEHIFCRGYFPVPRKLYGAKPEAAIVWVPGTEETRHQLEIHLPSNRIFRIKNETDWLPDNTQNYAAMIRSFGSVIPTYDNCISWNKKNGLGEFTVTMKYSQKDEDLKQNMISSIEKIREYIGLDEAKIEALPVGSSYHECGGLRMGSDKTGVCDAYGKFYKIPNLISSDAASWPDIPCANPHLTLAALSYFKADNFVKQFNNL